MPLRGLKIASIVTEAASYLSLTIVTYLIESPLAFSSLIVVVPIFTTAAIAATSKGGRFAKSKPSRKSQHAKTLPEKNWLGSAAALPQEQANQKHESRLQLLSSKRVLNPQPDQEFPIFIWAPRALATKWPRLPTSHSVTKARRRCSAILN